MTDTQASEAARSLSKARWGNQVLSRSVAVVVERQAELSPAELAELRAITERKGTDDGI